MPAGPAARFTWLLPAATALAAISALVSTNPGPEEFAAFAGEQLVDRLGHELCHSGGLPLAVQLLVRDCPGLIRQQQRLLGRLAAASTRRINAGVFSLYVSELGGQTLLPGLRIPRLQAITLAGAGQFTLLSTRSDRDLEAR